MISVINIITIHSIVNIGLLICKMVQSVLLVFIMMDMVISQHNSVLNINTIINQMSAYRDSLIALRSFLSLKLLRN